MGPSAYPRRKHQTLLVCPKDEDNIAKCDEQYIGESARSYGKRLKGHLGAPSSIYDYANTAGHHTKVENFSIVGREAHNIRRTIKEAMFIRVNDPTINTNIRKFQLSHILVRSWSISLIAISRSPLHNSICLLCLAHTPLGEQR